MTSPVAVDAFIARWAYAQSAERANYALFLTELCAGLDDTRDLKSLAPKAGKAARPERKTKVPWPKPLADRVRVVETALAAEEKPATAADLARRFARAKPDDILEILHTLVTLGRARPGDTQGTFVR